MHAASISSQTKASSFRTKFSTVPANLLLRKAFVTYIFLKTNSLSATTGEVKLTVIFLTPSFATIRLMLMYFLSFAERVTVTELSPYMTRLPTELSSR